MSRVSSPIIFIIVQVICKEPKRLHVGHEQPGINEMIDLPLAERFSHFLKVPSRYGIKKFSRTRIFSKFFSSSLTGER